MTPVELKRLHEGNNPGSFFFCRDTMRHWGDTMRNFHVKDGGDVWVLARVRPTKVCGAGPFAMFAKGDFRRVFRSIVGPDKITG